jgi:hypothetical protein
VVWINALLQLRVGIWLCRSGCMLVTACPWDLRTCRDATRGGPLDSTCRHLSPSCRLTATESFVLHVTAPYRTCARTAAYSTAGGLSGRRAIAERRVPRDSGDNDGEARGGAHADCGPELFSRVLLLHLPINLKSISRPWMLLLPRLATAVKRAAAKEEVYYACTPLVLFIGKRTRARRICTRL